MGMLELGTGSTPCEKTGVRFSLEVAIASLVTGKDVELFSGVGTGISTAPAGMGDRSGALGMGIGKGRGVGIGRFSTGGNDTVGKGPREGVGWLSTLGTGMGKGGG